jgi:hypothetical protein
VADAPVPLPLNSEAASNPEGFVTAAELREMTLADALKAWLPTRTLFISAKTYREYDSIVKRIGKERIGSVIVTNLRIDHIRQYQSLRVGAGVGPSGVNHEGSVIQQLLKRCGLWQQQGFEYDYQPIPLKAAEVGKALTDEEQERLLRVASSRPQWEGVYLFLLLSLNTTCGIRLPQELPHRLIAAFLPAPHTKWSRQWPTPPLL